MAKKYGAKDYSIVKNQIQKQLDNPEFQQKLKKLIYDKGLNIEDIQKDPQMIMNLMNDVDLVGTAIKKVKKYP